MLTHPSVSRPKARSVATLTAQRSGELAVATSWCNFLRIIIVRHDISLQQVVLVEELVPDDFGIWQIYLSSYLFDICDNIYMHIYIILCIL